MLCPWPAVLWRDKLLDWKETIFYFSRNKSFSVLFFKRIDIVEWEISNEAIHWQIFVLFCEYIWNLRIFVQLFIKNCFNENMIWHMIDTKRYLFCQLCGIPVLFYLDGSWDVDFNFSLWDLRFFIAGSSIKKSFKSGNPNGNVFDSKCQRNIFRFFRWQSLSSL